MASPSYLPLISYLRMWGNAATDDIFNGVTYWTDDQLEQILVTQVKTGHLKLMPRLRGSQTDYTFVAPRNHWYLTDFTVYNDRGSVITPTFTYTAPDRRIVFAENQSANPLYIEGYYVNMDDALAELWAIKAAHREHYVNFRGGHNVMNLREEYDHCIAKRDYYRNRTVRRWQK